MPNADIIIASVMVALLIVLPLLGVYDRRAYPESHHLTFGASLRLNVWALTAIAASFAARWWLHQPGLTPWQRWATALSPLLPGLFYALAVRRWLRGLDELQRRIQHEVLFLAGALLGLVFMALNLLQEAGCVGPVHWGWESVYSLFFIFWLGGGIVANRRYQ